MATDLGKVGIRLRGAWNSAATYEILDMVTFQHGLYIAKSNVPANTAPTNTAYWEAAVPPYTSNEITNLGFDQDNPVTATNFGVIQARGGTNGTKVYVRRIPSANYEEYIIPASTPVRIPIMPGEQAYYLGGVYSGATIIYPVY